MDGGDLMLLLLGCAVVVVLAWLLLEVLRPPER